jgi:HlyD family secretion protein
MKHLIILALCLALTTDAPGLADSSRTSEQGAKSAVVHAVGTLQPEEAVDVGSSVAGVLQKIHVDFRSEVKAGTVLAQLDPAPYEAECARARAVLRHAEVSVRLALTKVALAESEFKRVKDLADMRAVGPSEADAARAKLEMAKSAVLLEEATAMQRTAELQRAELNLSYCTIRSPLDGVVIDRRCKVGQIVTADFGSRGLFLIAKDLRKLQVWAAVREADIVRVAVGQTARFTTEAFPKETFQGRVSQVRLNATIEKGVVTYTVVIDVDNSNGRLLPYLTADVNIEVGKAP